MQTSNNRVGTGAAQGIQASRALQSGAVRETISEIPKVSGWWDYIDPFFMKDNITKK